MPQEVPHQLDKTPPFLLEGLGANLTITTCLQGKEVYIIVLEKKQDFINLIPKLIFWQQLQEGVGVISNCT